MSRRDAVLSEAISWMGTPYHHHGRVKGVGVDCVQILCAVYQACGVWPAEAEPGEYACDWHLSRSEQLYLTRLTPFADPVIDPKPGDIAVFGFGRTMSHGGIVYRHGIILHSYIGRGVIMSGPQEEPLAGRSVVYFDPFRGLE